MSDRPLCRYFMSNCCSKGDSCRYSHERNARPDMVCRYYLSGSCEFGSKCRYDHVRPKATTSRNSTIESSSFPEIRNSMNNNCPSTDDAQKPKSSRLPVFQALPSMRRQLEQQNHHTPELLTPTSSTECSNKPKNAWSKPLKFSVDAPIFVPRKCDPSQVQLCPYFEVSGECVKGDRCVLVHGDQCDMCGQFALHPYNEELRATHHRECLAEHEKDMNDAFTRQITATKQCGICMEVVVDVGARFGILQNCKHCFCLKCIREWRKSKEEFEKKIIRACPECRVVSDFIIPSSVWVEDQNQKDAIIATYQQNMSQKVCKYMGKGVPEDCPFGNKCFYKHQLPDGTVVQGQSPKALRSRLNHRYNLAEAIGSFLSSDLAALLEDLDDDE